MNLREKYQAFQKRLTKEGCVQSFKKQAAEGTTEKYLEFIRDEDSSAGVLVLAVQNLLGTASQLYKPEVLWYELDRDFDLDVPNLNRSKLLAAYALLETHRFFWDAGVFEKTTVAFNDIEPSIDLIQEPDPEHLCWAVAEAQFLLSANDQVPEKFNTEPQSFAATVLFREGFVLAPEPLEFSQEALDGMLGAHHAGPSKEEVQELWAKVGEKGWKTVAEKLGAVPETQLEVQLKKLIDCRSYLRERTEQYNDQLERLLKF